MSQLAQDLRYLEEEFDIYFEGGVTGYIEDGTNLAADGKSVIPSNINMLSMDSLVGVPNTTIPAVLATYVDPKTIEILLAKRAATEIFTDVKKGDFAAKLYSWPTMEVTGTTSTYSDYSQSGVSGINANWVYRENYAFQTIITAGDREVENTAKAKIALWASKQKAGATSIAVALNKIYLYGVEGLQNYGILNDPNLLPAITPKANPSGDTEWVDKSTQEKYDDILEMFSKLTEQSGANVTQLDPLTLALSPALNVQLGSATAYNISVLDMLNKYFSKLKIVVVPEFRDADGVETMMLIADSVEGTKTGECVFSERYRAFPALRQLSSLEQKMAASSFGAVVYRPVLLVTMTGM